MFRPAALRTMTWPGQCEVCRRWTRGRLCADCTPAAAASRCGGCGLRLPGTADAVRCGTCLAHPLPFSRCLCAVDYGAPWDRLILRYKYHGAVDLAPLLAERLALAVDAQGLAEADLVVPMPLAPRRLAERGYNQAWELARRVAIRLGRRADPLHCSARWTARRRPASTARRGAEICRGCSWCRATRSWPGDASRWSTTC
jgi:predicted amidophosphoribosyltransferase